MRNLTDYIYESMVNESSSKEFRFEFGDLDKKDETIESIEKLASNKGIYSEKIGNGIKIKGTDENRDKLDGIQDVIQGYVQIMQDKDDADQNAVKKLADQLNKLSEFIDEEPEEEEKKDDEDDDDNEGE